MDILKRVVSTNTSANDYAYFLRSTCLPVLIVRIQFLTQTRKCSEIKRFTCDIKVTKPNFIIHAPEAFIYTCRIEFTLVFTNINRFRVTLNFLRHGKFKKSNEKVSNESINTENANLSVFQTNLTISVCFYKNI